MQKTRNFKRDHRQDVLKETMEKLTFTLHPVPIYGQDHEKQKRCGIVSSLSLSCKTCLDKFIFWSDPLNLKTVERKGKTSKIFNISMKRAF